MANQALYNAFIGGFRMEETAPLTLSYQFSDRDKFTPTAPKYFEWTSSDPAVATIEKDEETGVGQIIFTGTSGTVYFTLTVKNYTESQAYTLETPVIGTLEGKIPFLNVPELSKTRTTLTATDTDALFASNVTARNAALNRGTTFTAKLYKVSAIGDTPTGDPVWTNNFPSTTENTVTHITIPGEQIPDVGVYAVEISTLYEGGKVYEDGNTGGVSTLEQELSATAYLNVKQAPAKVTLNRLDSYYVTSDNAPSALGYTVEPVDAQVEYAIRKSGQAVGARQSVSGGAIPFSADKPTGLKDIYTVTVYARSSEERPWSANSLLLTVYNADALDVIIADVAAGKIGGSTGGAGTVADGTTVAMDNHGKVAGYGVSGGTYQLTFEDFTALRTDMSLQKVISANYGAGVWGMLSDKMQWSSDNSELVSVDYAQGGNYADVESYSYASYAPATDFLLVGKGDTEESVTITATHANTGMNASFEVTAKTLTNQLYVFQFHPQTSTSVTYTNGRGRYPGTGKQ